MIGKCPHISSKILDFVATVTSLKVSMSGQKFLVLLPLTGLERSWCVVKKYPILLPWINCKLLTFSNQQRLMNVTQAQISTGVNSMFYTLRPWKQLPAIKKSYFYVLHIQRETFLNYSQSLLPDWWINIPPASSYWQAPSLITKHTHNSVSICCADNNGSGLLNSPHSASFLPLFTLKFSSSASMSLSVFFFFFPPVWTLSHEASDGLRPQSGSMCSAPEIRPSPESETRLIGPFDRMPAEKYI